MPEEAFASVFAATSRMTTDADLCQKVTDEFNWNPLARNAHIEVDVRNGVMTLAGRAVSYVQKQAIRDLAEKIGGVKSVINCVEVCLAESSVMADETLAQVVRFALDHSALLPPHSLDVGVEDGVVTLTGELGWDYQRREAVRAAGNQRGVREVVDRITLALPASSLVNSEAIVSALHRNAMFDAEWITVETYRGCVVLRGSVRSSFEREYAERIAWSAPGISEVINHLSVTN